MVFMPFMPLATCLPVFDATEKVALVDYSRDCFAAGWPGVARQLVPFLCFAKEKEPKERRPAVWVPFATLRGNLRCSTPAAVQTTRLRLKQVWPDLPPPSALLGPSSTGLADADANSHSDSAARTRTPKTLEDAPRSTGPGGSGLALV